MKTKFSNGFTLIELLVVIAIISLLSSVVLAAVKDAREKAQISATRTYLKQVVNAIELYRTENNAYPVSGYLSETIPLYLSNNITFKGLPNNIFKGFTHDSAGQAITPYYTTSLGGTFSCGSKKEANTQPYMIYYTSTRSDLNLPKWYLISGDGSPFISDSTSYYCATMDVN
jgi:prepilin-type N-terminal cleavage/methylation domain-containing protein